MILITPRENRILAADARRVAAWPFDAGYPEVSLDSLFGRLWYENYPRPVHAWETTGHESFESKFGLVPLVFGTLKATCFSMLFATPIALLAAIYSSQFMHPRWRARVKPTIEMMASLPSVVLGFIAGLILAPFVESRVMTVIAGCFTVPLTLLTGAHLWQLLPTEWRNALAAARFFVISLVALPLGAMLARSVGPLMERLLFQGDFRGWLDGREGNFGRELGNVVQTTGSLLTRLYRPGVNPIEKGGRDGALNHVARHHNKLDVVGSEFVDHVTQSIFASTL
jgi:phosphate transport system permease protein